MIDKVLKQMKNVVGKNNPKIEVNYIYYNQVKKELVATDTKNLMVVKYEVDSDKDLVIDVHKKGINGNVVTYVGSFVGYKVDWFRYPNYEKILPQHFKHSFNVNLESFSTFLNIVANAQYFYNKKLPIVDLEGGLKKMNFEAKNIVYSFNELDTPFMISGDMVFKDNSYKFKLLSMPLVIE